MIIFQKIEKEFKGGREEKNKLKRKTFNDL